MPAYNAERYIKDSIESILNQSERDFEFIIVDDGSTDKTSLIISSFSDPRLRVFKINHCGLIYSLNFGISKANGEYIARMDVDDISEPNRLKKQADFLDDHPDIALCGSFATIIDENGKVKGRLEYSPIEDKNIRRYALLHNPFIHPTIMIRKKVFDSVGMYKSLFKHVEDYELWTRVLRKYKGATLSEALLKYRIHENQVTKRGNFEMRLRGLYVRLLVSIRLFIF